MQSGAGGGEACSPSVLLRSGVLARFGVGYLTCFAIVDASEVFSMTEDLAYSGASD